MRWVKSKGKEYLVRLHDANRNGRSLGLKDDKTLDIYRRFEDGQSVAREKHRGLTERILTQARMNRALCLGRVPRLVAKIMAVLNQSSLSKDFLVIGTNALFAYEAMASVHLNSQLLAMGDFDLCFDAHRPLKLVTEKMDRHAIHGLLGVLKRADRSFETMVNEGTFRAVNNDGFMVDIITPERSMIGLTTCARNTPITFAQNDMVALEVPNLHWLVNAPKCREVVIADNGHPILMQAPDPRAFALHKAWLSQNETRHPSKRARDKAQAKTVITLVGRYLPNYPFAPSHLKYLSKEMIDLTVHAVEPDENARFFLGELDEFVARPKPKA